MDKLGVQMTQWFDFSAFQSRPLPEGAPYFSFNMTKNPATGKQAV